MCPGVMKLIGATSRSIARVSYPCLMFGTLLVVLVVRAPAAVGEGEGGSTQANDLCGDAIVIVDGTYEFSTVGAETDGMDGSACSTFGSEQTWNDIWYRYTPNEDGIVVISTCGTVDYDSRIIVYEGDCENLVEYACNDDGPGCAGYSSYLLCHGALGTEYFIRVGGYAEDQTGSGTFGIKIGPPCDLTCPAGAQAELELCGETVNDGCYNLNEQMFPMNEVLTPGVPLCGNWFFDGSFRDTDWFTFDVPEPGGFVDAKLYSSDRVIGYLYLARFSCPPDVMMYSYGGCPTTVNSPFLPPGSYRLVAAPGYDVSIGCDDSVGMDRYVLDVVIDDGGMLPPESDDCSNSIILANGSHAFSTLMATTDGPPDSPASCGDYSTKIGADIWFRYTTSCDGDVTVSTCDLADYDTRLEVWEGGCDEGVLVACNDDGEECAGFSSMLQFPGVCGTEYLIRVGGYNSECGHGHARDLLRGHL